MTKRWAALLAAAASLAGCASPPRTTVVLLPDEDGHVGAVVVSDGAGRQRLDQAFAAVTSTAPGAAPVAPTLRGAPAVERDYGALLRAQPRPPVTFTLHFVLDGVALTDESRALVPEMIQAARSRKPTEITVYGHADASGGDKRNDDLSAERARAVADLLRRSDPAFEPVQVQYFGARVPLVPGDGHSPEPRNRRVEVVIL